jgi:hypothetical protein
MRPSPILAANIWEMMHGGSIHLPIVLMLISAVFDGLGSVIRSDRLREQFRATGLFTLIAATLGAFPAVFFALVLAVGTLGEQDRFSGMTSSFGRLRLTVGPVSLEADRPVKAIERRSLGLPGVSLFWQDCW